MEASWCLKAQSELRQRGARDWVLLRAFCHQHGLEMDASRMVHLAADNDWVHFLAEASTQSYFYHEVSGYIHIHVALAWAQCRHLMRTICDQLYLVTFTSKLLSLAPRGSACQSGFNGVVQVVHAAVEYFQDGSLQHHVLHVLHGLAPNETPGPQLASGGPRSEGEDNHSRFTISPNFASFSTVGTHLVSITKYVCTQMIS